MTFIFILKVKNLIHEECYKLCCYEQISMTKFFSLMFPLINDKFMDSESSYDILISKDLCSICCYDIWKVFMFSHIRFFAFNS